MPMRVAMSILDLVLANFHKFMADLVESRIATTWNNMTQGETMDIGEVFIYFIDSSIMDVYDDVVDYSLNPFYQPWGFICQITTPFIRFFWQVFGTSPIFWIFVGLFLPIWCLNWVYRDYYRYLALGRGVTPSTFGGWFRTKLYALIFRFVFRIDVLSDPFLDPIAEPYRGRLFDLAHRQGDRPTIQGLDPQRQSNQRASPNTEAQMVAILEQTAAANPGALVVQQSLVEGHLPRELQRRLPAGLWRLSVLTGLEPATQNTVAEWGGAISHVHRLDSSAHVVLHPADAAEVIQKGWAERPPLACAAENPIWRFWHHTLRGHRLPLPFNIVLVYAPRNQAELDMFRQIIDAAAWWATLPDPADDAPAPVETENAPVDAEDGPADWLTALRMPTPVGGTPQNTPASTFATPPEGEAPVLNGDGPIVNGDGLGLNGDDSAATPAALATPVLNGDAPDDEAATPAENA